MEAETGDRGKGRLVGLGWLGPQARTRWDAVRRACARFGGQPQAGRGLTPVVRLQASGLAAHPWSGLGVGLVTCVHPWTQVGAGAGALAQVWRIMVCIR